MAYCLALNTTNNIKLVGKKPYIFEEAFCNQKSVNWKMTNNSCTSPPLQTGFSFNANLRISHTFEKVLHHVKTPFQEIVLYDTSSFGKVLFIDDLPQSNEADEHVYHETMVHSAMLVHPNPKKVFIGGGGEYATAREGT